MDVRNLRWWGWGVLNRTFSLEERPYFWPAVRAWLDLPADLEESPPCPMDEIPLRPSRLDDPEIVSLRRILGQDTVYTDRQTRIEHACGKSYRDLVRVRAGVIPNPPDAVIYPNDEGQVAALLSWAAEREIAVIPFGGGSTVLGGVEPDEGDQPTITLDTARLDRLVSLDPLSWTARIQSGATGPEVESQLNAQGFTLGHFPQSFQFSTLGGWLATRAAGQTSTGYGKIEDMVQAIRLVSPEGIIETRDTPAAATGPSLLQLLVGSEGVCGVITEATMRIHPRPAVQDYRGFLFRTMEDGLAALRDLVQHGPHPTIARLSDPAETAAFAAMAHKHSGLRAALERVLAEYLNRRGYVLPRTAPLPDKKPGCFLLLGYDGEPAAVRYRWVLARTICADHGGFSLGARAGESWKRDRFSHPYLRDVLLGAGVMVDTIETATTWANLMRVYQEMTSAIQVAIRSSGGGPGYVMTHISHIYPWGASLYTTFLGRQAPGQEIEQWWEVKRAATEAILTAGGTLSHHHGIGRDHTEWLLQEVGPVGMAALRALREALDPTGIMNPGVLLR